MTLNDDGEVPLLSILSFIGVRSVVNMDTRPESLLNGRSASFGEVVVGEFLDSRCLVERRAGSMVNTLSRNEYRCTTPLLHCSVVVRPNKRKIGIYLE